MPTWIDAQRHARAVLGAMMLDANAVVIALPILRRDACGETREGCVLDAIRGLTERGHPVDALSVSTELKRRDRWIEAGGDVALAEMLGCACPLSAIERHCEVVNDSSLRRALIAACAEAASAADDDDVTGADALDRADAAIQSVRDERQPNDFEPLGVILSRAVESAAGLATGYRRLDGMLGGLHPGQLVSIGGRPGMGKTAFGCCLAMRIAQAGARVGFFTLEMQPSEIADRMVALQGSTVKQARHRGADTERERIAAARLPVFVNGMSSPTVLDLVAAVRRNPVDLVVVDYLQLVFCRADSRVQAVDEIVRGLKQLAQRAQVPVVAMAQLNRSVEGDNGKIRRPVLSDLRESGAIENHSDMVLFVHRPKYYDPEDATCELIVAKNRQGPLGIIPFRFARASAAFEES